MARTYQITFRFWCREKWFEHLAELESYKQPIIYTQEQYFRMYKYWLKREYKHQQGKSND